MGPTARLRIALVRASYTDFGGAEQAALRTLQALAGQDVDLTLITRRWREVPGVRAAVRDPFYVGALWRDWSFARAACRAAAEGGFDLVQSHERLPCCDVYRAGNGVHEEWLRQRRRALGPFGRLAIALNPYHRFVSGIERRMFASARLKAVICNSAMVKEEIRAWFGVPAEKLHVIYSGVDTERFHPRLRAAEHAAARARFAIPAQATLFLYVGSGFERKGVGPLLEAMAGLAPQSHLLVVGKDKRQRAFERRAEALGIAGRVRFTGPLREVTQAYAAADAFVLPTLYDPFPNVVLEAMACGLPVVTSTKSGGAELIEEGANGFVCDALDVAKLRDAMRRLEAPGTREAMGAHARARVEPFTLQRMADRYLELYRRVLPAAA
ncbi:MAG TPA: glycosyltransferase family 4 protein [Burkholderiales bacterium]|nr:glycosyltransferase family 4 protein [Burkholderiales bacterium]